MKIILKRVVIMGFNDSLSGCSESRGPSSWRCEKQGDDIFCFILNKMAAFHSCVDCIKELMLKVVGEQTRVPLANSREPF